MKWAAASTTTRIAATTGRTGLPATPGTAGWNPNWTASTVSGATARAASDSGATRAIEAEPVSAVRRSGGLLENSRSNIGWLNA